MPAIRVVLVCCALIGLAVAAVWLAGIGSTPPPTGPGTVTPAPPAVEGPAVPELATGGTKRQPEPEPPADGLLLLPDGSKVAPLNGVRNPPKLIWQNPEWSPIVRTEHNGDYDWYVHEDGSYSTTLMIWRSDLNRTDAVSYCLHPRDAAPVNLTVPEGAQPPTSAGGR